MKDLLRQMAVYNYWANQKLTGFVTGLPEEETVSTVASSFNSLQQTILHIWDAESGWWQRHRLQERILLPSRTFSGNTGAAIQGLLEQSRQWEEWVKSAAVISLDHVIQFYTSKREPVKLKTSQLLLHLFNHSTYHRGQVITILHQLGHTKLPSTDFFEWTKLKK